MGRFCLPVRFTQSGTGRRIRGSVFYLQLFPPALAKELGKTPSASISPGVKRDPDGFCTQFCAAHAAPQRQPFLSDAKGPALHWQKGSGGAPQPCPGPAAAPGRAVPAFPAVEGPGRDVRSRQPRCRRRRLRAVPFPRPAERPQGPHRTAPAAGGVPGAGAAAPKRAAWHAARR